MSPFVIYLETNWLVSYVVPHHPWRSEARSLLEAADRGECSLRIPKVAFLEAWHVVDRETRSHADAVKSVAGSLSDAAKNLARPELQRVAATIREAEASYRLHNPRKELDDLIARCRAFAIHHPVEEQEALDALLPDAGMRGTDIVDMHILSAILADRGLDQAPEAAVLSANSKEFSVAGEKSKLPRDVYASRRLVYLDKFNLAGAKRLWENAAKRGWVTAKPPGSDPRLKEARSILDKLREDQRDPALEELRRIAAR